MMPKELLWNGAFGRRFANGHLAGECLASYLPQMKKKKQKNLCLYCKWSLKYQFYIVSNKINCF